MFEIINLSGMEKSNGGADDFIVCQKINWSQSIYRRIKDNRVDQTPGKETH
jgi:hypothetical protein